MQRPPVPPGTFVNELTGEAATPSLQMKVHTNICYKTEQLMADIRLSSCCTWKSVQSVHRKVSRCMSRVQLQTPMTRILLRGSP